MTEVVVPLTPTEAHVVRLIVGELKSYGEAAKVLRWQKETVRWYVKQIAQRIPGSATSQKKLIAHFSKRLPG